MTTHKGKSIAHDGDAAQATDLDILATRVDEHGDSLFKYAQQRVRDRHAADHYRTRYRDEETHRTRARLRAWLDEDWFHSTCEWAK